MNECMLSSFFLSAVQPMMQRGERVVFSGQSACLWICLRFRPPFPTHGPPSRIHEKQKLLTTNTANIMSGLGDTQAANDYMIKPTKEANVVDTSSWPLLLKNELEGMSTQPKR